MKVKLANGNAGLVAANMMVVSGDNFFHSLFELATFKLNDVTVEFKPHYAHRAFPNNLLEYGVENQEDANVSL